MLTRLLLFVFLLLDIFKQNEIRIVILIVKYIKNILLT